MLNLLKTRKGFTMLELLMVIIVIGILASLAIPQYQLSTEKTRIVEATNMVKKIQTEARYEILGGSFNVNQLVPRAEVPNDVNSTTNWYYNAIPADVVGVGAAWVVISQVTNTNPNNTIVLLFYSFNVDGELIAGHSASVGPKGPVFKQFLG
jgi:prepilin-type N-terminal cleavage/methylation domain-containing protein